MGVVNLWFLKLLVCACAMIFISSITDSRHQANGREINRSGRWNVRVFLPLKSDSHEIIEQLMKMPGDSSNSYPRKCVFSHTLHNIKINFMWLLIIAQNIETCKDQFNPSIDSICSCLFYLFFIFFLFLFFLLFLFFHFCSENDREGKWLLWHIRKQGLMKEFILIKLFHL